jgi:TonB family protein
MSLLASIPSELLKTWEGRVIDGQFPLQKWLGGSDHSAVFLTTRNGKDPHKAAIKLVWSESLSSTPLNEDSQLAQWREAAKLSHPHLIRLFESGRWAIDNQPFLYVVMEYAEEDLGQILPVRALSSEEIAGMLPPTAEAVQFLHKAGYVHGRVKPSNVMAVSDQLKISTDGLSKPGERARAKSPYDAPELALQGVTPAADVWSLGALLVAVVTQHAPKVQERTSQKMVAAIPETMPEAFRGIAQQCLRVDPARRGTVNDILFNFNSSSSSPSLSNPTMAGAAPAERVPADVPTRRVASRVWVILLTMAIAFLIVGFLVSRRSAVQPAPAPKEVPAAQTQTPPNAAATPAPPPAAAAENSPPVPSGVVPGRVRDQVTPEVSRGAQNTVHGHVKVTVHLLVDASGNVSQATITSEGPSRYFASKALAAARRWKFDPAKVDGQPAPSEWIVRFQFGRNGQQSFPTETKP